MEWWRLQPRDSSFWSRKDVKGGWVEALKERVEARGAIGEESL